MKDEIKEILDNPKILMLSYGNYISLDDYIKLKDCITNLQEQLHKASLDIQELTERDIWCPSNCDKLTNLQEENEYSDYCNKKLREKITNLEYKITTLEDYKTRNEKAIKELETLLPLCIMPNNTLIHATEKAKVIEKAINILQGKSDE